MRLKGILKTSENQRHLVLFYENTGENEDLGPDCAVWHTPHSPGGYYLWNVKLVELNF